MVMIWVAAFLVGLLGDLFRPAVQATVADLLQPGERVRAYGLLFWAINLGFSVSTVSAGVLASIGYGLLFWLNAGTSVIAGLVIWAMVPESRPVLDEGAARRPLLPVALRDTVFLLMILIQIGYATIYFQGYSTLPLAMADDGLPSQTYGLVIALNGVVIVLVQPFLGKWLVKLDRPKLLAASMLVVGLGFGLGAVVHSWWGYGLSVVVWTIGEIGFAAVIGAVFADLAPVDLRGALHGPVRDGLRRRHGDRTAGRDQRPRALRPDRHLDRLRPARRGDLHRAVRAGSGTPRPSRGEAATRRALTVS